MTSFLMRSLSKIFKKFWAKNFETRSCNFRSGAEKQVCSLFNQAWQLFEIETFKRLANFFPKSFLPFSSSLVFNFSMASRDFSFNPWDAADRFKFSRKQKSSSKSDTHEKTNFQKQQLKSGQILNASKLMILATLTLLFGKDFRILRVLKMCLKNFMRS